MIPALELGMLYGIVALGVYLTFRILNFPDLTVDGSFTTGAAVAASLLVSGTPPILATLAGALAGAIAGVITGLLYAKGRINGLLAGILTMIGLWSINLAIMGRANIPMLRQDTLMTPLRENGLMGGPVSILIFGVIALVLKFAIDWFLSTDHGLAIQATGNNEEMIRSLGVNTSRMAIITLALSNALVALAGALIAQYQGFADISMGIGLVLVGLASVIIGQAVIPARAVWWATLAVIIGAIGYRFVIYIALAAGLDPNYMKLISAVLVVVALLLPRWGLLKRVPSLKKALSGRASRAAIPERGI